MDINRFLDDSNRQLLADLSKDFHIEFKPGNVRYCSVDTINGKSIISFNPKNVDNDSLAHELLHIEFNRYKYFIGNHIYLSCKTNPKLGKVFSKRLCDYIGNCLDHYKMYPKYTERGYSPERFVMNGLEEKCSIKEAKSIKLSTFGIFNAKAIDMYIGSLISIYADHVYHDYSEHFLILKNLNSDLFDIVTTFWSKWEAFDIENIDPIFNSDIDLANCFISDIDDWCEDKSVY